MRIRDGKIRIRDPGWKTFGSGINIPQHWLWIHIRIRDTDPGFLVNTDPDLDFGVKKLRKKTLWKGNKNQIFTSEIDIYLFLGLIFTSKIAIYLFLGLREGFLRIL
jgi:hypothetical protein